MNSAVEKQTSLDGVEVYITETEAGDVIHYINSKKLYIVASLTAKGNIQSRLLYSFTQNYNSTKNDFKVVRLIKGNAEDIEERYNKFIEIRFNSEKNVKYRKLYDAAQRKLNRLV